MYQRFPTFEKVDSNVAYTWVVWAGMSVCPYTSKNNGHRFVKYMIRKVHEADSGFYEHIQQFVEVLKRVYKPLIYLFLKKGTVNERICR